MRKPLVGILVIILLLISSIPAFADGGFFTSVGKDIYEPSQKALIFYADGREDLVLSVRYEGNASDFAWVVPVPAQPAVDVADPELFWELAELTRFYLPPESEGFSAGGIPSLDVTVLEEKTVGPYDVAILAAEDPAALVDWLNSNGYSFLESDEGILNEYINKQWYFVASKISTGEEATGLAEGTIEPLVLSFRSDRIVYPLQITSLSSDFCEVLLYVFTEQPVVPEEYRFLSLNNAEQVAYFEREDDVFYIELRELIDFGRIVDRSALGQLLFYREFGEHISGEEYLQLSGEQIFELADSFTKINHLTKLRAAVTADKMIDVELKRYESKDYLDSDGDGWSDAEEALVGSDPQKADTDGDGMLDPEDPAPLTRDTLPDWSLPVALAASLVIALAIWLLSRRKLRKRARNTQGGR
ncbi:DUF2330 domain-containing protein [Chloroflexota bacterium]